ASVADLEALVRGTLDFARADLHAKPLQSMDIAALLGQMAQRYQRLGHDVALHAPAAVQPGFTWPCRPLALKRAVGNLVDNALAHGGAGAIEGIEWEVHADVLQIRVLDRGPGIAPESLARVLEPFQQNDGSRGPQRTGLGLGLPIAAACAEAQGGVLTLKNRADGGLCALLTLPRPPQQPA
ncbi:MAG: HAMP domain-containing histidine kinase, partial [Comamonadaceae bacterium]